MAEKQPTQQATQTTEKGLEIPIPKKRDVFGDLAKTARSKSERKSRKRPKSGPAKG